MKKLIFGLIILILGASAGYAFSISIDPPHINADVAPGQSSSGTIKVENLGDAPMQVEAFTEDWLYSPDGSKNFYPKGSTKLSCSKWIKLEPSDFELPAKTSKEVKYTIVAPQNAIGGHYSVIFFKAGLGKGMYEGQMVSLAGRIGSVVYQSSGKINKKASIAAVGINKDKKTSETFIWLSFKNEGNVALQAKGKINILDKSGKVLDTVLVENLNTLPGDVMTKKIKYGKGLPKGIYTLDAQIDYGAETKATLNKIVLFKEMILADAR